MSMTATLTATPRAAILRPDVSAKPREPGEAARLEIARLIFKVEALGMHPSVRQLGDALKIGRGTMEYHIGRMRDDGLLTPKGHPTLTSAGRLFAQK